MNSPAQVTDYISAGGGEKNKNEELKEIDIRGLENLNINPYKSK